MVQALLRIRQLSKRFSLHELGTQIVSCDSVDVDVYPGQLTALTGQTGCGKSSVLKCVYRTYLPSGGHIHFQSNEIGHVDLGTADETTVLQLRRQEIGFVTQFLHCLPRRPALQVVMDPLLVRGYDPRVAREQACALLDALNVRSALWGIPPATFSGGERQRINLARSLICKPRLLLLDEPTASLDKETTNRVVDLLTSLKAEGVGMLAVFHDPELVDRLADHHLDLSQSKLEFLEA